MSEILVTKRDGRVEPLDIEKLHKVVIWATENTTGTSASEVEIKSHIQFYNKIKTADIQETLIKSAADLITEETPNYQFVAGRLIAYHLRKMVYGSFKPWHVKDLVKQNVELGLYDAELLDEYSDKEWDTINNFIKHERDENLTYAAMEQMRGKYLVQNRVTRQIFETPQMAYALIAVTLFAKYPKEVRLQWAKEYYNAISTHEFSLPTPIMAGVRTSQRQFSSCVLIDTDDSLDSINATASAIVKYVSQRAGIGINVGKIRALGSPIRNGDAYHTGITPFLKYFESAVNSCSQGGIRKGSATCYYPIWHLEVEDLLVLKNNKGIDENRVRDMDYAVQFNKLFYERLINGQDITLFSPSDVPGLYEAFFEDQEKFREIYETAERNTRLRKKTIPALELFSDFVRERKETGRIYLMNVDHCNEHGSFIEDVAPVHMSNLCVAGDTKIDIIADGNNFKINIEDLGDYQKLYKNILVKSHNLETDTIEYKTITAFAMTSESAEVYEIEDEETGYKLVCTGDHQIYTKNRGYVRACELVETDVLVKVISTHKDK